MHKNQRFAGLVVLGAASIVSAVLGSIHAFSVFMEPLENQFSEPRSAVSLTYSLALVALTLAVLFGPKIYGVRSAAFLMLFVCFLAASGALLAGMASSLLVVWVGYSLVFGIANGLGYGFGLQIAAQFNPGREGLAMGTVTASYAFGAMLSPVMFDFAIRMSGFGAAMMALAVALLIAGLISAFLMWKVGATFLIKASGTAVKFASVGTQQLLWLGYFGGVLAGLMVIGHAAGIATSIRPDIDSWVAPAVIAASNLFGSLVAGRLADKFQLGKLLILLALITPAALFSLTIFGSFIGVMLGFAAVGFAYGGTIATYPAVIVKLFGMQQSAIVYGRVFTAWGFAGLVGPWLAGFLFDWSGGYHVALLAAATIALVPIVVLGKLVKRGGLSNAGTSSK